MAINKNYLQLEFGSGKFFLYSKEEKEGYEKHVSTKGNTSYRKYFESVSGVLESVSIYDGKFGQQISMNVKNGDDVFYIPVALYDQRGNVDNSYAESLIRFLPELNKGDNVEVRGYNFVPEGEKYSKIGMSVKVDGEKVKPSMTNSYFKKDGTLVEGDIPPVKWKRDALGKNKPSAASLETKDEYLIEVLKVQTDRLKWDSSGEGNTNSSPSTSKPQESSAETPKMSPEQAFSPSEQEGEPKLPF